MDSVKSNLLFSNAGCRISEAYIFRLFTEVPIRAPNAHRGNCQPTHTFPGQAYSLTVTRTESTRIYFRQ